MRSLCFLSLGLLLAAGCADTAQDYDVNKPVITEPVPHVPVQPDHTDTDLDADLDVNDNDAINDATDNNTATPNSAAPGAAGSSPAASGAIENDAALDETEPVSP